MKTKSVKIRLTNDMGHKLWLTIDYICCNGHKRADSYYLTENARWASAVPLKEARCWMREAKCLASSDGDVVEKAEYILRGEPTTLKAAGLR